MIGCDGVNSVVSKWLGLDTPVSVGRSAIRGLVEFPNGSSFDPMFHVNFGGGVRFGFLPVDDKTVYWFCTFTPSQVPSRKSFKSVRFGNLMFIQDTLFYNNIDYDV